MSNGKNQYRPMLKKRVTTRYQDALDWKEGLDDLSRVRTGKRILQRLNRGPLYDWTGPTIPRYGRRLNRGPMYDATRYERPTIGGLEPPGIPKIKNRPITRPFDAGKILHGGKNWQKIKRHVPPLGTHKPKPVKVLQHFKPEKSVLKVKPNAPLDPKYHRKFQPTIIKRSRPSPPPALNFQRSPIPSVNPNQPNTLRQIGRPLFSPNRARPMPSMQNPLGQMTSGLRNANRARPMMKPMFR